MKGVLAFGCGVVFALGLGLAGMTQPGKVTAFLDVAGAWDPSLAFVMLGAVATFAPIYTWSLRRRLQAPVLEPAHVDARLVAGALVFGIGWGVSGFCPGPAIASLGSGSHAALVFVPAMLLGMLGYGLATRRARTAAPVDNVCG